VLQTKGSDASTTIKDNPRLTLEFNRSYLLNHRKNVNSWINLKGH